MKKTFNIIKNILSGLLFIVAVCMMIFTIISVSTFDRNDRSIFGYKAFVVLSDSMSATDFNAGDVVICKEVEPSTLKPGDIISYKSQNEESYGDIITHKIRKITTDENGNPGFVTYGTTTDTDDKVIVTYPSVVGKYELNLPKIGMFFQFLRTIPGYITCILIPFMILILKECFNFVKLFREYKQEKMEELQSERNKLDEEKAKSEEMMKELLELRAQLAEFNNN